MRLVLGLRLTRRTGGGRVAPRVKVELVAVAAVFFLFLGALAADAQQPGRVPRVGFLAMGQHPSFPVFMQGLRDLKVGVIMTSAVGAA